MTADCAAAVGQRAEQGMSWLGEGGSILWACRRAEICLISES